MMEGLARYALGLIGGVLLVGILGSFPFSGSTKKLIQMAGGIFLTLLLVQPVVHFDWKKLSLAPYLIQGETIAADGQAHTAQSERAIIKSGIEAYILDKATALNAEVKACVELNGENIPESAVLEGSISPYARARLSRILEEDLGISKEQQQWKN